MKKIFLMNFLLMAMSTFAQRPSWVDEDARMATFPGEEYLTGFAVNVGNNSKIFADELKVSARTELIEGIEVGVQSKKMLYKSEKNGIFGEEFTSTTNTFANAEINDLKIEYYYDASTRTGYALAYANKNKIRGYYTARIDFIIRQVEAAMANARQQEFAGSKGQARKIYKETVRQFEPLSFAQRLLIAIGSDEESIQIAKSLSLKTEVSQAITRMETAIRVYIVSEEKNLEKQVSLLEPKLKALLSGYGCSYVDSPAKADWVLNIKANTRTGREVEGIFFSFLDVIISLVEQRSGKEIYGNNFTGLKGGGLDYESAGLKAYESNLQEIAKEIASGLEK